MYFAKWGEVEYNIRKWDEVVNKIIMLIGEYTHTLDDKNRVSLPVKFRKEIGKNIILVPWLDNCVALFTMKEWTKLSTKLAESSLLQTDNRSFNRFMFGQAVEVTVDSIGRILVPDFLKERAGLKGKVSLIGVSNRIELWNDVTWQEYKKVVEGKADSLAEKLGSVGVL
jgi:MraZ protein